MDEGQPALEHSQPRHETRQAQGGETRGVSEVERTALEEETCEGDFGPQRWRPGRGTQAEGAVCVKTQPGPVRVRAGPGAEPLPPSAWRFPPRVTV